MSGTHEYHLRRKTPNGTIDAGYDGTPVELASQPPPFKQMVIPGSLHTAMGNARLPTEYQPAQQHNPYGPDRVFNHSVNPYASFVPQLFNRQDVTMDCAPNLPSAAYQNPTQGSRIPTALQPMYHHPPGPALFNPGGPLPPNWHDGSFGNYQPVPPTVSQYGISPYYGPNHQGLYHIPQPLGPAEVATPIHYNSHDENGLHFRSASQQLASLTLGPQYESAHPLQPRQSSRGFRDKALANAHTTYLELLAYLHNRKKSGQSNQTGAVRNQSKMVIFPKLPKPLSQTSSNVIRRQSQTAMTSVPLVDGGYGAATHPRDLSFRDQHAVANQGIVRTDNSAGPAFYHLINTGSSHFPRQHGVMSPLAGAQAAVEMLHNLCEQSGWKWADGILLGGCLHYGLEQYDKALEWFQRILVLDESHIEAISNIAATLYSLNRHEQAEKQWRYAIQKRPDYLEAAEHLVGLLCSHQRTREAVEVVEFVQRSLQHSKHQAVREDPSPKPATKTMGQQHASPPGSAIQTDLPGHEIGTEAAVSQPGFASSGYLIPGSENGRMIALIHAKGNLLYALKDIGGASAAFEEVVLLSAGRNFRSIQSLIRRVKTVLAPPGYDVRPPSGPLLLPPEVAKQTAQKVFGSHSFHGSLPGLRFVTDGLPAKSAISTTSNSLLSLAKIFQDSMSNGISSPRVRQSSGVGDILALYYLSLSLSASPSTANNIGILLAGVQQCQATITPAHTTTHHPTIPGIVPGSGLALALAYYQFGLQLDNKHVHLHTNLGSLLKDAGQLDLAIQMYERAVACDGTFDIALTNLANAVKDRGRVRDAIHYYRRAVDANPHFAEAVCGLATALNSVCDWRGRGGVFSKGGKLDRWHVNDAGMVEDAMLRGSGAGWMKKVVDIVTRQLTEASHWGVGVLQPETISALTQQLTTICQANDPMEDIDLKKKLSGWAGQKWEGSRVLRLVERGIRMAMWNWYQDKYIRGRRVSEADFPRPRLPNALSVPSAPTVLPFHTFTCPLTAKDIRMISQRNAARISCSTLKAPWLPATVYPPPPPPRPQLNIGYVSSDFNNHPLAHLMQSVFGFHDPSRAKAFCYATTPSDGTEHRLQIEQQAPVFRDVSTWPSERLVDQIVQDQIHILVNLNGYTRGARNEVFAARPAPIQMSFMGFAGTLGAEWCDYLLADETAIPASTLRPVRSNLNLEDIFDDEELAEADDWMYPENIIFCRDTFFCCDHAQSCGARERQVTWEDEQLRRWQMRREIFPNIPDNTIILGNFNQLYKIEPSTFRTWLRILSNVPNAILWLLKFPELGEKNLKRTAAEWAGDEVASRIYFTEVAPKQQHIARARVCDLFLDTPECNGHTTAADVLWSSTPLLTLPRYEYKMCSRMAASILKGALPKDQKGVDVAHELIAADDAEYEIVATRLAGGLTYHSTNKPYREGRGRLAEMRKVLFDAKWTCALFDTRRWVRDLEEAYDEAWRRWESGEGGDIHL
ncbi:glycosyl transferase family 41-domain-containing protein [Microdochium trichocladiopsis]|uniref:protein O-GlcNAc transferase n=1 Tax=Microdochium trichocladiopsis TaxID=1682393 RepID=A0A9P8YAK6_9PEZI|nr:glycosyl transferase family 41-domain-containing protein [Microdochium trichocladiopsis]KAH7032834.1 glycosyl transferase family 41-domain-containing protein [Microdochium trichocladiopsis]